MQLISGPVQIRNGVSSGPQYTFILVLITFYNIDYYVALLPLFICAVAILYYSLEIKSLTALKMATQEGRTIDQTIELQEALEAAHGREKQLKDSLDQTLKLIEKLSTTVDKMTDNKQAEAPAKKNEAYKQGETLKSFADWRPFVLRMEPMLRVHGFYDVMMGAKKPEESGLSEKQLERVGMALNQNLSNDMLLEAYRSTDKPWDAWETLRMKSEGSRSGSEAGQLRSDLDAMSKCPKGMRLKQAQEFFNKLFSLNNRIGKLDNTKVKKDDELGDQIVRALYFADEAGSTRFATMADDLLRRQKDDPSVMLPTKLEEQVIQMLKRTDPDARNDGLSSEDNVGPTALSTFKGKCFKCGEVGHKIFQCPKKKDKNRNGKRGGDGETPRANVTISLVTRAYATARGNKVKTGLRDIVMDGATQTGHLIIHREMFVNGTYKAVKDGNPIAGFADAATKEDDLPRVVGTGDVAVVLQNGSKVILRSARHVPKGSVNLFSVRTALVELGKSGVADARYEMKARSSKIMAGDKTILTGSESGGLFYLNVAADQDFC